MKPDPSRNINADAASAGSAHVVGPGSFEGMSESEKAELRELLAAGEEEEVERRLAAHHAKAGRSDPGSQYLAASTERRVNFVWSKRVAALFAVGLILLLILLAYWILHGGQARK